jgi:DNA modification methylase
VTDAPQATGLVALAERIELWPIERLRPYERNPRTHSEAQVDQIAASMIEFGWTNPVLVDEQGGILAGHGRLLAARNLGLAEVPVIRFEQFSEAQKRAYRIGDNQLALNSTWDEPLLAEETGWLRDEKFDLDLLGFDASELERLLALADGEAGSDEAEDEVPEPPEEPVSKPGDLWILGNHRLLCGDATVLADIERVLGGQLADMTWTDPPYNVDYANTPKDKLRGKHRPILNDNLGGGFEAFLLDACVNILGVTKGAVYVCMSSSELHTLQRAFAAAGGKWSTFVIWAKSTFTLGRADYQRQYEPILYGWKDGADHYWCGARDQGDVWFFDKPVRNDLHPTMKPVALVERAIRNSSKSRDVVLDPFGGSGSTLIACEKAGRQARLVELEPKYCDVIVQRWQEFSGGAATLARS